MTKQVKYIKFWNSRLKWTLEKEMLIYKYLCEDMNKLERWKYLRKKDSIIINTYSTWTDHVKENVNDLTNEEKKEFIKYLSLRRNRTSINDKLSVTYLIPITVAMISPFIPEYFELLYELPKINDWVLTVVSFILLIGALYMITKMMYQQVGSLELKHNFYKDYIDILNTKH